MPAYNEELTISQILARVSQVALPDSLGKEVIVVNDGSTDNTERFAREAALIYPDLNLQIINQPVNRGKGAAIRRGIQAATGNYLIIQDADLEYDPRDYLRLLEPILAGLADVVYGSRFVGGSPHRILFFWHSIGNRILTFLSNALTNLNLTDMETCYKCFRSSTIKGLRLQEDRFGFEPEVTARIARVPKIRIYEVGISYYGRTYEEGKKIGWKDGLRAIYAIGKYNLFN